MKYLEILGLILGVQLISAGCSSIAPVGTLGPLQHPVYIITHNDFLSASRMLVVTDAEGRVIAATGGTVPGMGSVAVQAGTGLVGAGSVIYAASSLATTLTHADVTVKGSTTTSGTLTLIPPVSP